MKRTFLVFLAFALIVACHSGKNTARAKSTDLVQQNLNGPVERLEGMSYTVDSGGESHLDSVVNVIEFDKRGYATRYINKTPSGELTMDEAVARYDNGAVKEFLNVIDGKQISKLELDIDKEGKYSAARTYESSNKQDSYYSDLAENEWGIVYAARQHFMNGKIESTFDLQYDKANIIGGIYTDSLGRTSYSYQVKLDARGNPIQQSSATLEKDSTRTEIFVYRYNNYDGHDNWLQRTTYNNNGKPAKIEKRTFAYYAE